MSDGFGDEADMAYVGFTRAIRELHLPPTTLANGPWFQLERSACSAEETPGPAKPYEPLDLWTHGSFILDLASWIRSYRASCILHLVSWIVWLKYLVALDGQRAGFGRRGGIEDGVS